MARRGFVFNNKGFIALRKSPEVQELVRKKAQRVADAASAGFGGQYKVDVKLGGVRTRAQVNAADYKACMAVLESNALLKSIDAARD